MNEEELKRNPQLTEYIARDLNSQPSLPYEDNSFDVITNCVSVDYLNKPLEVGSSWWSLHAAAPWLITSCAAAC